MVCVLCVSVCVCPLCVALAPACGPRCVAPRPDFLIGRARARSLPLRNCDRFPRARFLSSGVSRGLLACCSPLCAPCATTKVTHYYSSSHSFRRMPAAGRSCMRVRIDCALRYHSSLRMRPTCMRFNCHTWFFLNGLRIAKRCGAHLCQGSTCIRRCHALGEYHDNTIML